MMTPRPTRAATGSPITDTPHAPALPQTTHVLIIEDDHDATCRLRSALDQGADGTVTTSAAATLDEALEILARVHVDCVLLDLGLHDTDDLDGLHSILEHHPGAAVVVLTRRQNDTMASDAVRAGAQDHLCTHELTPHTLQRSVGYAVQRTRAAMAERRLAMLLNRASEVVLVVDTERVVTYASESIESVLGYTVDQVVGHPGAFFTHPDDLSGLRSALQAAILHPDETVAPVVVRALHADGSDRWGEVTIVNHLTDPAIGGLVLNIRDITERHNITRQLEAEHAQRDAIVARSSDLVMFFELDGTITWASPASQSLFGIDPDDLVGRNGLDQIHPLDQARVVEDFATITGLGDHVRTEFRIVDARGDVRWVEEIATNLVDEPTVGVVVGNLRDVTDRKRAEEAVQFQARLLGAAGQAIVAFDQVGTVLYWNTAAVNTFGWSEAEAVGNHVGVLIPAVDEWEDRLDEILPRLADAEGWSGEFRVHRKDGREVPVHISHTPLFDDQGEHVATIGVYSDISELLELTRQVEEDRRRLADAQASAMLGSFEIDLATGEVARSDELYRILGCEPGSLQGVEFGHIHPEDVDRVREAFDRAVQGMTDVECTHRIQRPNGEVRWVLTRSRRFEDAPSVVTGTMLDITERREAELAIEHIAYHDPLTGLANRMTVTARLDDALLAAADSGRRVAVALIDVDQFKAINDTLGHSAGDTMLHQVARRLESAVAPGEIVARFGGDEFAVVHGDAHGPEDCTDLGDRLLAAFAEPIPLGDREFRVTISIGLALGGGGDTADSIFLDADTAMYHAKETGRARAAVFDQQLQVRSRRRRDVEDALRDALGSDQLSVVFQPVLELLSMHTAGFEALLRWTHPDLGVIRPDEFIPIAEETGLILSIGEWVLLQSLHQVAYWHAQTDGRPLPWIAVNLSARQLEREDLVERVRSALQVSGVPAEYLHLEITESILMDTIDHSLERLLALRELGIRISIDDFGTGYSSLSYLKRLPIDTLKIDRSFIDGLGTDPEDTSIVQTIMSLATTLNLRVLAEGVENSTQLHALMELGCEYGQGFLWSPGLPPERATDWVHR